MARNPAAQTAFGPMVQVAIEQYEPPRSRLVDDDLALTVLPAGQRAVVRAMRWEPLRRWTIAAGEKVVPGAWTIIACRKRFIDEKLLDALADVEAVVILGSGMDTRGLRLAGRSDIPVFEVDLPVNIARKKSAVERALGAVPSTVHLVPVDFERDDLLSTLTENGYSADARAFFVWEGVTQYLTEDAVRTALTALQGAPTGSRLAFSYVSRGFIDGADLYGAKVLYKRFRQRRQVWKFGLEPGEIDAFIAPYGWRLVEQAGPGYYMRRYVRPSGRDLTASGLEWTAYCRRR